MFWDRAISLLDWQLLDPPLIPWLPWVNDCQSSILLNWAHASVGCFEYFMDTLRKLHGNHCWLLLKQNSISFRHWSRTLLVFLPSQALVNTRWFVATATQTRGRTLPLVNHQEACKHSPLFSWGIAMIGASVVLHLHEGLPYDSLCEPARRHLLVMFLILQH
jgi:hypothetical protein